MLSLTASVLVLGATTLFAADKKIQAKNGKKSEVAVDAAGKPVKS